MEQNKTKTDDKQKKFYGYRATDIHSAQHATWYKTDHTMKTAGKLRTSTAHTKDEKKKAKETKAEDSADRSRHHASVTPVQDQ